MKLLVIEDEQELLKVMVRFLKREGFICETVTSIRAARRKLNNYQYDCVIVNLNLPDGDGMQLVKQLRKESPETGVIITSASDAIEDRLIGLEEGADDFLIKPYILSELNARIKAILRRKLHITSQELHFGELKIRLDAREVTISGELIPLTKKEYDILVYLARNKNRVVTKDAIAEYLWGDYMDDADSYDFIYAHLKNLRKKLSKKGIGELLKTVYGIGYKFTTHR
ncbi:MAG: response regulator transcription factor [Saprospiraceae bacterium]